MDVYNYDNVNDFIDVPRNLESGGNRAFKNTYWEDI